MPQMVINNLRGKT